MKIKNRNVSFLALTLAGALSLVSLEGVYAGDKEKDTAESQRKDWSKEKKKGADPKDVSGKKEDKIDKKPETSNADEKSKSEETTGLSGKEEAKFIVVQKDENKVILETSDKTRITVELKARKAISEDCAAMMAMIEFLEKKDNFGDVYANFRIFPKEIEKDLEHLKYLIERGFKVDRDGFYVGRVYGLDIKDILMELQSRNLVSGSMRDSLVELAGFSPETAKGMPDFIATEEFKELRDEIKYVARVIPNMMLDWADMLGTGNMRFGDNREGYGLYGRFLQNDKNHALMMKAEMGLKAYEDFRTRDRGVHLKYTLTIPAGEAVMFAEHYGLKGISLLEGEGVSFDIRPEVFGRIVEERRNLPAEATLVFGFADRDSYMQFANGLSR